MKYYSNVIQHSLLGIDSSDICKILFVAPDKLKLAIYNCFDMKHRLLLKEEFMKGNQNYKESKFWYKEFIKRIIFNTRLLKIKNISLGSISNISFDEIFVSQGDLER